MSIILAYWTYLPLRIQRLLFFSTPESNKSYFIILFKLLIKYALQLCYLANIL